MKSKAQNMARIRRKLETHTQSVISDRPGNELSAFRSCDGLMEIIGEVIDRAYAAGLKDRGNVGGGA